MTARALTIIGADAVAALEAAGLTVEDAEWSYRVEQDLLGSFCWFGGSIEGECKVGDPIVCMPCRARWRIAEREKRR